ncbi:DUF2782 domain-containing protein [Caldimonas taiwanensis]|uniref:DUF2782 domain-containing protein n=1 Tax=Caldimonas taiwanensis TaxID=307483 RepID=UPI001E2D0381|nr:DUF2782 domain-containing protein [Caldimonas taiwanensis]
MRNRACLAIVVSAAACSAWGQAATPAAGPPEPAVQVIRVEDESTRIDELRVRGQTLQIRVQPKKGGRTYEVVPPDGGRDPSQVGAGGASGQRVWRFLTF